MTYSIDYIKATAVRYSKGQEFICNDCGEIKADTELHPNLADICIDCWAKRRNVKA